MFSNPISKKSNISEANKHLQLLYDRLSDCENALQEQTEAFAQKEEDYQEELATMLSLKETEIFELKEKLEASESLVHDMSQQIQEKDKTIKALQSKADMLDQITTFKPMLEQLLITITYGKGENMKMEFDGPNNICCDQSDVVSMPENPLMVASDLALIQPDITKRNQEITPSIQQMVKPRDFSISDDQSSDEAMITIISKQNKDV